MLRILLRCVVAIGLAACSFPTVVEPTRTKIGDLETPSSLGFSMSQVSAGSGAFKGELTWGMGSNAFRYTPRGGVPGSACLFNSCQNPFLRSTLAPLGREGR